MYTQIRFYQRQTGRNLWQTSSPFGTASTQPSASNAWYVLNKNTRTALMIHKHTLLLQCLLITLLKTRVITTIAVPSDNMGFAAGRGDNRPQKDAGETVAGRQLQAVRKGDALLNLTMCVRARANKVSLFTPLPKTALRSDAMCVFFRCSGGRAACGRAQCRAAWIWWWGLMRYS